MTKKAKIKSKQDGWLETRATRPTRLERATAAYYRSLSGKALEEERCLEGAVAHAASQVNLDE